MLSTATLNAADLFRCGVTRASTGCRVSTIERHCVELINGNLRDRRRSSILEPTLRVLSLLTFLSLSLSTYFRRWNFRRRSSILGKKDEERTDRKDGWNWNEMRNGEWWRQLNKRKRLKGEARRGCRSLDAHPQVKVHRQARPANLRLHSSITDPDRFIEYRHLRVQRSLRQFIHLPPAELKRTDPRPTSRMTRKIHRRGERSRRRAV